MDYIKNYIWNILGFGGAENLRRTSFKRDRTEDELSFDEDSPALKRLKSLQRTKFPEFSIMNDDFAKEKPASKIRYVPIQIDSGHPSTSTPNFSAEKVGSGRVRSTPIRLVDVAENGPELRLRAQQLSKPRMHTPVRPTVHAVIEDDDDDDNDVTWIESPAPAKNTKSKVYINIDDEDDENECDQDDVIFVKKIKSPQIKNNDSSSRDSSLQFYKVLQHRKVADRNTNVSPKPYTKFKAPAGISKSYKKAPTPIPKWMQPLKTINNSNNMSQARNKYLGLNGNARSAISEVFNLDEKRSYQELIRRVASSSRPFSLNKSSEIVNLADDSASFRSTVRAQKKALQEIQLVEKGLRAEKDIESSKEYDPVVVASINSSDSEVEIVPSESSTSSSIRIDPINTLRDSQKDSAITSKDWLSKLDYKYNKKRQETQEKLKDARRESDIISKVNYEQKIAHLEQKLKHELSIPESLIEEAPQVAELPELTPEQEKVVSRAIGPGPPNQLLVEKFNLRIHRRDLQTLAGLNWLNDEVINFYMNLLMQRSEEKKDLPKVYATNTFFYPKLMQSGQPGLRRWTRKVDIFAHDLLIAPVHLGVHWCLSYVDFRERRVCYLDSMGGRNQPCLTALMQYLRDEHQDKKGTPMDDSGWKLDCLSKDIPQQMNGSDCGMFACTFAEFTSRGAPYSFTQQHMPALRRKMAYEILQGRLLL